MKGSVDNKPSNTEYRAVLSTKNRYGTPIIRVEQNIKGGWHAAGGGWGLDTLNDRMSDSIWIDHGQKWSIDSGMKAAIEKANEIVSNQGVTGEVEEAGQYTDNAWSQGINDNPEYQFYVLVKTDDGSKIYSGWEYREDAIESLQDTDREGAVVHKPRLAKYGVDANNDKDWLTSPAHSVQEGVEEYYSNHETYSEETMPIGSLIHSILNINADKDSKGHVSFNEEAMQDLNDLYKGWMNDRGVTEGQVMRQADQVLQSCRNGYGEGFDINERGDIVTTSVEENVMEDMDVISDEELNAEFRDLGPRLKQIIDIVKNADTIEEWKYDKSQIELSPSVKQKIMRELETAVFRYHAARQGLGIANKLKDDPSRMKHKRRVMGNLNALRAFVQKLERILKIKD